MQFEEFTKILQMSISPVVLISGIGLLMLSMTNCMGRVVENVRALARESREEHGQLSARQIFNLYRRARLLHGAIILSGLAILFTSVIIILLFAIQFYEVALTAVVALCFVLCMGCLIVGTLMFVTEIGLSLKALNSQLRRH